MKITAQDALDFYVADWSTLFPKNTQEDDWYLDGGMDEDEIRQVIQKDPEGEHDLYEILGELAYQGAHPDLRADSRLWPTTERVFTRWKKSRNSVTFSVTLPRERVKDFRAAVAAMGGKIK